MALMVAVTSVIGDESQRAIEIIFYVLFYRVGSTSSKMVVFSRTFTIPNGEVLFICKFLIINRFDS